MKIFVDFQISLFTSSLILDFSIAICTTAAPRVHVEDEDEADDDKKDVDTILILGRTRTDAMRSEELSLARHPDTHTHS